MKKLALLAVLIFPFLNPSQASTMSADHALVIHRHSELKTRMQIRSVMVHALPRAQRRLVIHDVDDDDDDGPDPDDISLHVGFRRPDVYVHKHTADTDVSDYVKVRLAVARAKAMAKYKEVWC
jgi:hypothetical protein